MGDGMKGKLPKRSMPSTRRSEGKIGLDVIDYYGRMADEDKRVNLDIGRFEYVRTKEIIGRYLSSRPRTVVDVGGGTGAYSFWLAELGHHVHLVDIVPRHIELARLRSLKARRPLESLRIGEAKSLPFDDSFADVLLSMGPLYHITERRQRILVLKESARVLKKGGIIFCAAISRFASMLDGFRSKLLGDPRFECIVDRDLASGRHKNIVLNKDYFTTAYFHKPEELKDEMNEAGLTCEKLIGVEGPIGIMNELNEWLDKKDRFYELSLKYMKLVEEEGSLLGVSFHLLAMGRKDR